MAKGGSQGPRDVQQVEKILPIPTEDEQSPELIDEERWEGPLKALTYIPGLQESDKRIAGNPPER